MPTLKSLSLQCQLQAGEVAVPMLDARRMEVYMCAFDHKGSEIRQTEAKILEENSLSEWIASFNKVYFIGSGAQKAFEVHNQSNISVLDTLPSAKEMSGLSYQKYVSEHFEDVAYFEPYYLKDFMGPIPKKKQ